MGGAQAQFQAPPTVYDIISKDETLPKDKDESFSIFGAAIKKSNYDLTVGSHDMNGTQYTILAMSNDTLKRDIGEGTLTDLLSDNKEMNEHLKNIAGSHILKHDRAITTEFLNGVSQGDPMAQAGTSRLGPFKTLNPDCVAYIAASAKGPMITLENTEGKVLGQTTFETRDHMGSNGVVHVVKNVMILKD